VLHAFRTIHERHTCGHRVSELLGFIRELDSTRAAIAHSSAI